METRYLTDWTGTRYGEPFGLERPSNVEELCQVVRDCYASARPLAVQGGRTGVSGGAAPGDGEVVLSLERFAQVDEFDRDAGVIVVQAGAVLEDVQKIVEADGWCLPLDLASRGTCQIGGNVATNAGGSRVIKYGTMRALVLGVEAVLADGSVLGPVNRLVKNNAGYAFSSFLVGSEGTLGVVARAALRLVPMPPVRRTALLALASHARIGALLAQLKRGFGDALSAFEIMWPDFVDAASAASDGNRPLPSSFAGRRVALVEVEGRDDEALTALLEDVLGASLESDVVDDIVLSASARDASQLWGLRESVGEIQSRIRPYVGFDLSLPASVHDDFVEQAKASLQRELPLVRSFFFGHAGDDNLHAVIGPAEAPELRAAVENTLHRLLPAGRSSVTAEHGIGRKKKAYLGLSRSPVEIEAMRAIKRTLDPRNILNPGRIFDL